MAFFVAGFWGYANAHAMFSFPTLGLLQKLTFVVCPPAFSLMATEHTGPVGTLLVVAIVAAQNFIIYFLAAALFALLWGKFKRAAPTGSKGDADHEEGPGRGSGSKNWRYFALIAAGFLLLVGVSIGLTNFVMSFGWTWYYVPGPLAVLAASLICFRAAGVALTSASSWSRPPKTQTQSQTERHSQ